MTSEEQIVKIVLYVALGGLWGVSGIIDNVVNGDEQFDSVHFFTTLVTYAAAGGLVAVQDGDLEPGALEAVAAGIAPVVDKTVSPYVEAGINAVLGRDSQ